MCLLLVIQNGNNYEGEFEDLLFVSQPVSYKCTEKFDRAMTNRGHTHTLARCCPLSLL